MKNFQVLTMLTIGAVCSIAFSACTDDAPAPPAQTAVEQISVENPYLISQEEAIAEVLDFLETLEASDSRSQDQKRSVKDVVSITIGDTQSRVYDYDSIMNATLLYVVNFDNEEGFVIVAGDIRVPQKVLVFNPKLNFDNMLLNQIVEVEIPPLNFPWGFNGGVFTDSEYPGEYFINPDEFDFYYRDRDEYIVGNYEAENIEYNTMQNTAGLYFNKNFEPGLVVAKLCIDYARLCAYKHHFSTNDGGNDGAIGGGIGSSVTSDVNYSPWRTIIYKSPMLESYDFWTQFGPFNNYYPLRHAYSTGEVQQAATGCLELSVAKLLAFFQIPSGLKYNGIYVDWTSLSRPGSSFFPTSSAALLRYTAENLKTWSVYNGSFSFPSEAVDFMKSLNLKDVMIRDYTFGSLKKIINLGCPAIVYSLPENKYKMHAWIADGYREEERTKTIDYYAGSKKIRTETITENRKFIHLDFGWGRRL